MDTPRHRRDFVRTLALAAPAALVVPGAAVAADDEKATRKDQAERSETDARMDLVLARYGKLLDEAARKKVRAEVDAIVRRADALRKFALDNGDGPFPVFQPYRAPLA